MIRLLGLSFVVVCLIGWVPRVEAQTTAKTYSRRASAYNRSLNRTGSYRGFGLETMQTPFAGMVVMDRFGLVHRVSVPEPDGPVRAAQARSKATSSLPSGRAGRSEQRLPTGSLNWAGASGVLIYSPALRYQNYGSGYALGPYGSVDCGMMYHGMWLGR